jgi:CheY-like chemotaxis protein
MKRSRSPLEQRRRELAQRIAQLAETQRQLAEELLRLGVEGDDASPAAPAAEGSRGRVLVVEDEPVARDALRWVLEDNGYTVQTATNAAEAVLAVESFRPVCVMLDLGLPDQRDGLQLAKVLHNRFGSTLLVIVVSAHSSAEVQREARRAGADYVLGKPVDIVRLNTILGAPAADG